MKPKTLFILLWLGSAFATALASDLPLDAHLEPLRPLLEKTWQGTFSDSKADKPVVDVGRWERALNGQAIRRIHSVNNGAYGGEALIFWDDQQKVIAFHYFTTAHFWTVGTMKIEDGKFITHEDVKGDAGGITEVRATSELLPNGKMHLRAEYLKNGKWELGREVTYEESPGATVIFK